MKPKILVTLNSFWSSGGSVSGGDQIAHWVFNKISNSFSHICVLTTDKGFNLFANIPNVKHIGHGRLVETTGFGLSYILRTLSGTFKIMGINVDIVYTGSDFFTDVIPAFVYKLIHPSVSWYQSIFHLYPNWKTRPGSKPRAFLGFYLQRISLLLIKKADSIICINSQVRERLIAFGFDEAKLTLIYPGIDYMELRNVTPSKDRFDATFLARLNPSKGIFDIPKIWRRVCDKVPNARLAVIGGGSEEVIESLQKEIVRSGLESNIKLLGFLEDKEAFGLIKASSVFVFPSHEEGFGIALAEALACGTPAVAWDLPVYSEVFGNNVVEIEENNFGEFTRETIELIGNSELRDRISEEGVKFVEKYSWDSVAKQYLQCLTKA